MTVPALENVQVLVTGGAGFIGSHLVDRLVACGARVRVLDDLSTGHKRNLADAWSAIEFIEGDIRDIDTCRRATQGTVYVFHEAALGSVPRSMNHPDITLDVNVRGTANLFTACREARTKRVIYASSSSVYGDGERLPKREGEEGRPLSPYALSKVMNEQLADVFGRCFGMEFIGLRYFNVYGPRQSPDGPYAAVVPRFCAAAKRNEPLVIYGDGEQSRDFTFVADAVEANLRAAGASPEVAGRAYNVAPGCRVTVNALAELILQSFESESKPSHVGSRSGDVLHSQADPALAKYTIGFKAEVSLVDGISRTAESLRPTAE